MCVWFIILYMFLFVFGYWIVCHVHSKVHISIIVFKAFITTWTPWNVLCLLWYTTSVYKCCVRQRYICILQVVLTCSLWEVFGTYSFHLQTPMFFFWSKQFAYDVSKDCLVSSRPLKPLTKKVFTFTHKNNTTWWFNVILSSPSGRSLMPGTCLFQPKQTSQNELPLEGLVIGQTWHLKGSWRFSFPFGT